MAQLPRPVSAGVAAAEEDDCAWVESLDIDDSDLKFSPPASSHPLCPSTAATPHTDKPSRPSYGECIPGPASAVQDTVRRQDSCASQILRTAGAQANDTDFLRHPWLCALQFLGEDRAWEQPGIKKIKTNRELDRAPLVVGVVTSCKPNMVGDLFVTLKDPTDTIGATVHRKALSEGNDGQDISVGCVILLRKVAVFRPSHAACYLNITKPRIVKVVQKDCDPSFKQEISSGTTESQLPAATWKGTQCVAQLGDERLETSEGKASIFSKMVPKSEGALAMFGRDEARDSANIMTRLLPSSKEMSVAEVSCNQHRRLEIRTSAQKLSSSTDLHSQQSFLISNTACSQPIPDRSSLIPAYRSGTQASDDRNLRLPFADELILPSSKKPKTDAVLRDCYVTTMNTSMDTKGNHRLENNMDIDLPGIAAFHGGNSTMLAGSAQPTKETSATDAAANNGPLLSQQKTMVSLACPTGWTDEQISELFVDY